MSFRSVYDNISKIDGHLHLNSDRPALADEAEREGFELLSINTEVPFFPDLPRQEAITSQPPEQHAARIDYIATFSTEHWDESFWQDRAIKQIEESLNRGAVGIKVWKNIGMELKDSNGNFVMADHPSFDPIYSYLEENRIPMLAHLGEPKNCWLPLEEMTVTSDRDYFSGHPQYHMHLHPEYPSYEEQLSARDRLLAKHPDLVFIGAHLASLEWSVDEVARWLDDHPLCGVDLAERVCHLQHQAAEEPERVKQFIETYQDRIIYGTDQIDDGSLPEDEIREAIRTKWHAEFRFFAESTTQTAWNVEKPFRGLGLDEPVLLKLFHQNALKYYPALRT